jgi:transposase-like protein
MVRDRRLFSEELKREVVELVGQPGASKAAIARDLGIGANPLGFRREMRMSIQRSQLGARSY